MNAAGVLQVPMAMSVWDDGYGISVSTKLQTTKANISKALSGFEAKEGEAGIIILNGKGWDYPGLCEIYASGVARCRKEHVPVLFHINEITQPQGHSTSGSHERYKSKDRLAWEQEYDCVKKMREWMIQTAVASEQELEEIESAAKVYVRNSKRAAWEAFQQPLLLLQSELTTLLSSLAEETGDEEVSAKAAHLKTIKEPLRRDIIEVARFALRSVRNRQDSKVRGQLQSWISDKAAESKEQYNSWLTTENEGSALKIEPVKPIYGEEVKHVDGREILRDNFDKILETNPLFLTFGEDSGGIGGVNQTLEGLQKKYGEIRVADTGIREATIVGQGIGLAMRGLRPIAEIQYLDYLLYAIQILSDDLATLRYRTKGNQKAPLIISTRGHRLEGVWHSGSPMGMIINAVRGMFVCVPRNMTQAAGFYNTLLAADDPALVIEPLNGYRLKERLPENMGEFRVPLGVPEILKEGNDITLVTYGSCCKIASDSCAELEKMGVSVELIDVQTLLPFDLNHVIAASLKKTGKLVILDEDVPGGASGFILQQILEVQKGFRYLDADPVTISAQDHRPAYGSDGDYFSKPAIDDVVEKIYGIFTEYNPSKYPSIY